jgi:BirA family transcriptional regulator, biotin operon repressor / biotin---[acetyl-CoA-carboxylase] ligase
MGFALAPKAERAGFRLKAFDTVASTNAEAMALGRAGETGPLWVVSKHQTAGRGRRGRPWATPPGNLAASLLHVVKVTPAQAATIGFVAGLALEQALRKVAPGVRLKSGPDSASAGRASRPEMRFALKWPNDVLANGAKLAGILLESETLTQDARIVVVGIGVNVLAAPRDVPYPATSLAALEAAATAEDLFEALSESWVDMEAVWDEGRGMARLRELWLASAAGLGAPVSVKMGGAVARGIFETIDEAGQLIVRKPDGSRQAVAAGEVHFGVAATSAAGA